MKKRVIVSVTNDLTTDQRADKICLKLAEMGFDVILIGRQLPNSSVLKREYKTKRFILWFNKGAKFYANYNLRLFFYLLFNKFDLVWSNDLDTLSANYRVAKLKRKPIIYDSHEYFTEVPELNGRERVKNYWLKLERKYFPRLKHVFTVSSEISIIYSAKYNVPVKLLRNVPFLKEINVVEKKSKLLIYQGAINVNRGIETMVQMMEYLPEEFQLKIYGDGDIKNEIVTLINKLKLDNRVEIMGRISLEKLHIETQKASLGLSLEEDVCLSYKYALPNKMFDYIHADVPVLVADLPEMKNIIDNYQIGEVAKSINPKMLAVQVEEMLNSKSKLDLFRRNFTRAKSELNWEKESLIIEKTIEEIFS